MEYSRKRYGSIQLIKCPCSETNFTSILFKLLCISLYECNKSDMREVSVIWTFASSVEVVSKHYRDFTIIRTFVKAVAFRVLAVSSASNHIDALCKRSKVSTISCYVTSVNVAVYVVLSTGRNIKKTLPHH